MAKRKILFVSKDMGGGNVLIAVAKMMRQDHEIIVVAEGLSVQHWHKDGFNLYFQGTTDYRDEPFTVDAEAVLKKIKPDIIVAGLGSPINLEEKFGLAANAAGIPLVWIEDFWGGSARNSANPNIIFTLDAIGKNLIRNKHRFEKTLVKISGNLALNALLGAEDNPLPEDLTRRISELRKPTILLAGGGLSTTSVIKVVVESLEATDGEWTLIPRLHPKHSKRKADGEKTYGDIWKEELAKLGDRVVEVPTDNADALAQLCDITVSAFSTLLIPSVAAKKIPISVRTPEMIKDLSNQAGLERYPLVEVGAVLEIERPIPFHAFLNPTLRDALTKCQTHYLAKTGPFDQWRVSQEILALCA